MGPGRPYKEIDKKLFESLCAIQCTLLEMCAVFDCDDKTLEAWCKREYGRKFSEIFREKRRRGMVSLRRAQYQKAVDDKNTAMLIFLGKNWLGQSDKVDVTGIDNSLEVNTYDLTKLSTEELNILKEISMNARRTAKDRPNRSGTRKTETSKSESSE